MTLCQGFDSNYKMHTDSQWLIEHPAMRESVTTTVIEEDIYSLMRAQGKFSHMSFCGL